MLERLATVVNRVGAAIIAWREEKTAPHIWEGDQLKTETDSLAHELLVKELAAFGLSVPVISEEDVHSHVCPRPEKYWLIDPIDGTRSYTEGFSGYVTQAALMQSGQPVLSAIFAPATGELFLAERGGGASLNNVRISVQADTKRRVLVDNYPEPRGPASFVYQKLDCTDYLECGSIALKICRVAQGSADIFFKNVGVRDWDVAPAHLVIEEAQGSLSLIDGAAFRYDGSYEKRGVLAVGMKELADAFVRDCSHHLLRE